MAHEVQYDTGGGSSQYVYNPKTGKWERVPASEGGSSGSPSSGGSSPSSGGSSGGHSSGSTGNSNSGSSGSSSSSQMEADRDYIEIEFRTLVGQLRLIPTPKTISLRVGQTIELGGIGSYLSGKYFISDIRRTVSNSGYTHTLTVIKTGFGDDIKTVTDDAPESGYDGGTTDRPPQTGNPPPSFNVGTKVKFKTEESKKYQYTNGVFVPLWVTKNTHTINKVSSDERTVRLKEINSWVYAADLKQV